MLLCGRFSWIFNGFNILAALKGQKAFGVCMDTVKSEKFYSFSNTSIEQRLHNYSERWKQYHTTWREFRLQKDALEHQQNNKDLHVFCQEVDVGKRIFVTSTYDDFWNKYEMMSDKHWYELIIENTPCKLYLDLEFKREFNPGLNDDEMMQILIRELDAFLYSQCTQNLGNFIQLDSSTDAKFSRHIIAAKVIFQDNIQLGYFLQSFVSSMEIKATQDENIQRLFVSNGQESSCLLDLAVYTRNRQFRIYKSSKFGKNIPLMPFPTRKFIDEYEYFLKTLVCSVSNVDGLKYVNANTNQPRPIMQSCNSSFPLLDEFVLKCANQISQQSASIKTCIYYPSSQTVVYGIQGTRFCCRIGREHKSNGVYYVADLINARVVQKCYDPDCRSFQSPPVQIPETINPLIFNNDFMDDCY